MCPSFKENHSAISAEFLPLQNRIWQREGRKEKNIRGGGGGEVFLKSFSKQEESQNIIIVQRKYSDDFEWANHGIFHLLDHKWEK